VHESDSMLKKKNKTSGVQISVSRNMNMLCCEQYLSTTATDLMAPAYCFAGVCMCFNY